MKCQIWYMFSILFYMHIKHTWGQQHCDAFKNSPWTFLDSQFSIRYLQNMSWNFWLPGSKWGSSQKEANPILLWLIWIIFNTCYRFSQMIYKLWIGFFILQVEFMEQKILSSRLAFIYRISFFFPQGYNFGLF